MLVRHTRLVGGLLMGFFAAAVTLAASGTALADGSGTLYPASATCTTNSAGGSCRANIEWRANSYGPAAGGPILRRTLFSLFAHVGEVIETGSSAVGVGAGDILVFNPGVVTDTQAATLPAITPGTNGFTCSAQRTVSGIAAQGQIATRVQELAGPQAVTGGGNPTGYVPCSYIAPATGIYHIAMYGPAGDGQTADGTVVPNINAVDTAAAQGTSVSAWDVTVRADATSTTDIPGRLFTYALAAFTAGNGLPLNQRIYVTTTDGFRYQTDTNGLDPNGFLMYGNQRGFLDADGVTPLDHDALATTNSGQLTALAGGVTFAAPQYPLSFTPLSNETIGALGIPLTAIAPVMSNFSFAGSIASNVSLVGASARSPTPRTSRPSTSSSSPTTAPTSTRATR